MRLARYVMVGMVLATAGLATAAPLPHVNFALTFFRHELPDWRTCEIEIAPGWNTFQVLDTAAFTGCISMYAWDSNTGKDVTCFDDICSARGWHLRINETSTTGWFFQHTFNGNESLEFVMNDGGDLPVAPPPLLST